MKETAQTEYFWVNVLTGILLGLAIILTIWGLTQAGQFSPTARCSSPTDEASFLVNLIIGAAGVCLLVLLSAFVGFAQRSAEVRDERSLSERKRTARQAKRGGR